MKIVDSQKAYLDLVDCVLHHRAIVSQPTEQGVAIAALLAGFSSKFKCSTKTHEIIQRKDFYTFILYYRLLPLLFTETDVQRLSVEALFVPSLSPLPLPPELTLLGFVQLDYNVVEYTARRPEAIHTFACSPFFCNALAHLLWVNQTCLLPDGATAYQVADLFAKEQPEPVPSLIVEVLAKAHPL